MGHNRELYMFVAVITIFDVVGIPHSVTLLTGFVGLQRAEDRFKKCNFLCNSTLPRSEEIKYIVWLQ